MIDAILHWDHWEWAFLAMIVATLYHVGRPRKNKDVWPFTVGAVILLVQWLVTFVTRDALGTPQATVFYIWMEVAAALAYTLLIVSGKRVAVWAAMCVLFEVLLGLAHFRFLTDQPLTQTKYIITLNVITFLIILTINAGKGALRYNGIRRLDIMVSRVNRRFSFSGACPQRDNAHSGGAT